MYVPNRDAGLNRWIPAYQTRLCSSQVTKSGSKTQALYFGSRAYKAYERKHPERCAQDPYGGAELPMVQVTHTSHILEQ